MVDDTQEQLDAHARFVGWLNVAMLAWMAFDVWMLPAAGAGGGGAPRIGGIGGSAGGAGAATAGSVLASAEAVETLRRLAVLGALTAPKLVQFIGGRSGGVTAPTKPIQASAPGGKPPDKPGGGASRQLGSGKTGKITSDLDVRSAKQAKRSGGTPKTVYEVKKASSTPSDQAEVRMAELLEREGREVHFNAADSAGDLTIDGRNADVKMLTQKRSITSAVERGAGQAPDIIIDGTQVRLTHAEAEPLIRDLEAQMARHPGKYRNLETIYLVEGSAQNPSLYIRHLRGAPLRTPGPPPPTIRGAGPGG